MARKNVKISEVTHERLKHEQKEGETMDDTIQRLLGIGTSAEDVGGTVAAYQSDLMRDQVKELKNFISSVREFNVEVDDERGEILFKSPNTGITVAKIICRDNYYVIRYLSRTESYRDIGPEVIKDDYAKELSDNETQMKQFKQTIREKVEGAYRRWGE
jgi:hypothetical protein